MSGPSADTVAMNFGAVTGAGDSMAKYSKAVNEALEALNGALNPVRETWYNSGSESGDQARLAETNLRSALVEMANIINRMGAHLRDSAIDAAARDRSLANLFPVGGGV